MSQTIDTGRFGKLDIDTDSKIVFPNGIIGFPEVREYCLVDPGDDTLILWLQSLNPEFDIAFPVLEPKIFKRDYAVSLSGADRRELQTEKTEHCAVLCILTITDDITQMTANLKAPLVLNLGQQLGKQVVLQENEYQIRHPMFKELRAHLMTISQNAGASQQEQEPMPFSAVRIMDLPSSGALRPAQL
jgi:flagellar assembly factor FliW